MTLIIIAIIGFSGQILTGVFASIINGRNSRVNRAILESTHIIVNNQRTVMLHLIMELSKRIALENPGDKDAQEDAIRAHNDYLLAEKIYR